MNKLVFTALLAGLFFFSACASKPRQTEVRQEIPRPVKRSELFQVLDYKARAQGEEIPDWVNFHLWGTLYLAENQGQFGGRYLFVNETEGTNLKALGQWLEGFTVTQDFARLTASRIMERFSKAAGGYPDDEYGAFFEAVVKKSFDTFYEGAVKEDDFWLLKQYYDEDGITVNRELYTFLILVSIDQDLLESQINALFDTLRPEPPPSGDQTAAINRIKGVFFDGF
jgi:hypothetical protein